MECLVKASSFLKETITAMPAADNFLSYLAEFLSSISVHSIAATIAIDIRHHHRRRHRLDCRCSGFKRMNEYLKPKMNEWQHQLWLWG